MYARRDVLRLGGIAAAAGLANPGQGLAQSFFGQGQVSAAPREIAVHNLHTGESIQALYYDRGAYVPDALNAMNKVLRDFRTGDVFNMDPQLFDLLHTVQATVESRAPFQIISGYRSPRTNAMLHECTPGVANNSYHMRGMATDIRLPDVELSHLHRAALLLQRGGVGYYPSSDFIHVDVGPVRSWG